MILALLDSTIVMHDTLLMIRYYAILMVLNVGLAFITIFTMYIYTTFITGTFRNDTSTT